MKKLLTFFAFAFVAFAANAQTYCYDTNGDGEIDINDVMCLVNKILGVPNPGEDEPQSYLTCPDNHHPHLIDLGLPSGTKWACCNVGAAEPREYGDHYSWGECWEKDKYSIFKYYYSYTDGDVSGYWDYDSDTGYWHGENLGSNISGTNYDVAHVKWGEKWVMPSESQFNELIQNCTCEFFKYDIYDTYGIKFTGTNGGNIILPAAGNYINTYYDVDETYNYGYYWTSEPLEKPTPPDEAPNSFKMPTEVDPVIYYDLEAYCFCFNNIIKSRNVDFDFRFNGCSVRPVWAKR